MKEVMLNGVSVPWDCAVELMDDDIREYIATKYHIEDEQGFMNMYSLLHWRKYGEEFEVI